MEDGPDKQDGLTDEINVVLVEASTEINISATATEIKIIETTSVGLNYNNDPAKWDVIHDLINYFAENIPSQNEEFDFLLKGRKYNDVTRYPRKDYFIRRLTNGEIIKRDWLIYSPSTGTVYCYICKLFHKVNEIPNQFIIGHTKNQKII